MSSELLTALGSNTDAFLAAVVDCSSNAVISCDLDGTIVSWNASAERIFGYSTTDAVGRSLVSLFAPERQRTQAEMLHHVLAGETVHNHQTLAQDRAGKRLPVAVNAAPMRDRAGQVMGLAAIVRDIRAEANDLERFRVTLASIGDAVISTDVQGRIQFMNGIAEELTGWRFGEAAGRPLNEVFVICHERTRQRLECPVGGVIRQGTVTQLPHPAVLLARDGTERPVDDSAAPIRTALGELIGVVLVFRDATERHRTELAVRRLAAIVEGSEDAIIGKDLAGRITSWNPGAERIFGYTADEMVGATIWKIIPPERQDEERTILQRLAAGERVKHIETVRIRKDGTRLHVSLSISPIRDADGRIIGASKIVRDITAQKESEIALRQAQVQLESHALQLERTVAERTTRLQELVSELEAFSYSLSHDLRAPLRTIQGFTEIVLTEYGDRVPEAAENLKRVIGAAARMDRLIQDVLAFARVSREEIVVAPVDVDRLVRDIVNERPELQLPKAEVVIAHPLHRVMGHDASLTRCLANLLENAVKFVPSGTTPHVHVSSERHGDRVRLSVRDNGIGIDPEGQKRLFVVFQRLATRQRYEGTGIGLAIVRKATERMGGRVGVTSAIGEGSTFWIELAAAD